MGWPRVDKNKVKELYLSGKTQQDIADILHCARNTVSKIVVEFGIGKKECRKKVSMEKAKLNKKEKQRCSICNKVYPLSEFLKTSSYCRSCNSEYRYKRLLQAKYGLTYDEYNKMFQEQNGCCFICGKHQSELKRKLFVDHNHRTGEVRKLLCNKCNSVLGLVEEDKNILVNVINYLETYNG